jgi:acetyl-CoA carboxylase biotin carboxyl carrier protein
MVKMNTELILAILDKFNAGETAELILKKDGMELTLRRESAVRVLPAGGMPPAERNDAVTAPVHLGLPIGPAAETGGRGGETIVSPIVAVFYPSPDPGAPPFVNPGSRVKTGDTLCILEAMKMMNHLEAEFDCEIVAVLPSGGDMVEYGQPLFEVKRL